jgi:hypothetical protein
LNWKQQRNGYKNIATLINTDEAVILAVNKEKTKLMELLGLGQEIFTVGGLVFEKVDQFNYLGATIKSNNDWSVEIVIRGRQSGKN